MLLPTIIVFKSGTAVSSGPFHYSHMSPHRAHTLCVFAGFFHLVGLRTYNMHLLLAVGKCPQLNVSVHIGRLCTLTPTFMVIYHHSSICATKR